MSFFTELKRRNVFRVGFAYLVSAWLTLQITDVVLSILELSGWIGRVVFVLVALGFPVTLVLAWIYELTPEGIKREEEVDRDGSITASTGRKLDFVIIGVLAVAVTYFAINHDWSGDRLIGTASGQSIAVLPFANRSALEEDDFFVDGVHDDLLTLLSKLGDLKVISRTSVEKFRSTGLSIPEVAGQLGVATVLEGAVQRAGGQVRINVQLIDAGTDEHLWAETYDRELTAENIFAIQSDIARVIAQALQKVLTPAEQSRVDAVPTSNYLAYEEFLRGKQKMVLREIPEIREAVEHFRTSIELDPRYAMAYVALADAYHLLSYYGAMSAADTVSLMEAAVSTALELDPELGEARTAFGALLQYKGQFNEAITAYREAIELAPGYATSYHWLAEHFRSTFNDPGQALPLITRALELDPLSPVINITVAETLRDLGRNEEALAQIDRTIELAPDYAGAYQVKAQLLAFSFGKLSQAMQSLDFALELDPQSLNALMGGAQGFSDLGDDARAVTTIERCLELGPDYKWAHFAAMFIYENAGDTERTLHHARRAHTYDAGLWGPLRILRNVDIDNGQAAAARQRYEAAFPNFPGESPFTVTGTNWGAAIDYAYLLSLAGDNERVSQLMLPVLEFLQRIPRLGFLGKGIDDVQALVLLGEYDKALETLEAAVSEGWRRNWRGSLGLRVLDPIRDDPRFVAQKEILEADAAAQLNTYLASLAGD